MRANRGLLEQEKSAVAIDLKKCPSRGLRGCKTPGGARIERRRETVVSRQPPSYPDDALQRF